MIKLVGELNQYLIGMSKETQTKNSAEISKEEVKTSKKCSKHPRENNQFYCPSKDLFLCSECLINAKKEGIDLADCTTIKTLTQNEYKPWQTLKNSAV